MHSSENSVSGKEAVTLLTLDSEETTTFKFGQNIDKKRKGNKPQIETSTNVSNTSKRLKMTAKLSELSNVTLPSILNNIFDDYDTSGESSKRRDHKGNDKVKRENNKTKKGMNTRRRNNKIMHLGTAKQKYLCKKKQFL